MLSGTSFVVSGTTVTVLALSIVLPVSSKELRTFPSCCFPPPPFLHSKRLVEQRLHAELRHPFQLLSVCSIPWGLEVLPFASPAGANCLRSLEWHLHFQPPSWTESRS